MKGFIASLAVFGIVLTLVICNYIYIEKTCAELTKTIEALPPCEEAEEATKALFELWERKSAVIGISVSLHTLEKMDEYLAEMKYAVAYRDVQIFESARYCALAVIQEIESTEAIRPQNWI